MNQPHYEYIALDSHVHFYSSWQISLDTLLDITFKNITSLTSSNHTPNLLPAIFLLDTSHDEKVTIKHIISDQISSQDNNWKLTQNQNEHHSFWATRGEDRLLIISGDQIVTSEGLEVLVVGETSHANERMDIGSILKGSSDNTLNIIPWAVGKWLGKRGKAVTELLSDNSANKFVLGDNSGRPWPWKNISQFHAAKQTGFKVLAGSDPLPLNGEHIRSGRYGSQLKVDMDLERPLASIIDAIHSTDDVQHFGRLSSISRFLINQLKLRLN